LHHGGAAATDHRLAPGIRAMFAGERERRRGRAALRGGLIGAAVGGFAGGVFALALRDTQFEADQPLRSREVREFAAVGAAGGALVGAGIGALLGR
jgi:hypothetical protein